MPVLRPGAGVVSARFAGGLTFGILLFRLSLLFLIIVASAAVPPNRNGICCGTNGVSWMVSNRHSSAAPCRIPYHTRCNQVYYTMPGILPLQTLCGIWSEVCMGSYGCTPRVYVLLVAYDSTPLTETRVDAPGLVCLPHSSSSSITTLRFSYSDLAALDASRKAAMKSRCP